MENNTVQEDLMKNHMYVWQNIHNTMSVEHKWYMYYKYFTKHKCDCQFFINSSRTIQVLLPFNNISINFTHSWSMLKFHYKSGKPPAEVSLLGAEVSLLGTINQAFPSLRLSLDEYNHLSLVGGLGSSTVRQSKITKADV